MTKRLQKSRDPISSPVSKRRKPTELSKPIGDRVNGDLDRISIYSWNVNGIEPFVQRRITSFFKPHSAPCVDVGSEAPSRLRDVLRRYAWPTFFLLQEIKIRPGDEATMRAIEKAVVNSESEPLDHPSYRAFFCLPRNPEYVDRNSRKIYGVCTLVRTDKYDELVESIREVEWDGEGRFLVCETKQSASLPNVAIINTYAVNGTDAPYKKDGKIIGTRHDRKLQVHAALQEECRRLESRGFYVILAGDMNIARSHIDGHPNLRTKPEQHCWNRADFEHKFLDDKLGSKSEDEAGKGGCLGMIDTFRYLHPKQFSYTYYPRGKPFGSSCDRVDLILISRELRPQLVEAGIKDTPDDRGPSDHVPLYCTFQPAPSSGMQCSLQAG